MNRLFRPNSGMNWKEFSAAYLSFTRRDRLAILVILALILIVLFLPEMLPTREPGTVSREDTAWISALRNLEQKDPGNDGSGIHDRENHGKGYSPPRRGGYSTRKAGLLFNFDPNTLPAAGWEKLGLREKTIQTILKYRSRGGRFRKPDDLQRIYGLSPDEFERIAPYIRIPEAESADRPTNYPVAANKSRSAPAPPHYMPLDVNTADTTAFIALPGIGSKLSFRIVNFREKLGGFYSVEQVAEVYGLPDSTFQKIKAYLKLENTSLRKINLNTATLDELKGHPYIRYSIANAIIAFRKEHGPFLKMEDLKKVMAVTEEVYKKASPYFSL